MKTKFIAFLKKYKCLQAYRENLKHEKGLTFDKWADLVSSSDYLIGSFVWKPTKQGHSFWSNLNYKWQAALKQSNEN